MTGTDQEPKLYESHAVDDLPEHIAKRIEVDPSTSCWVWTGSRITTRGQLTYGRLTVGNRTVLAHRLAYEHLVGKIPNGLEIDHLCRNQACCNPAHMEPVTAKVNQLRGTGVAARNKAKTHCKHGHEYTDENTLIMPSTKPDERKRATQVWRLCATCYPSRYGPLTTVAEFMGRQQPETVVTRNAMSPDELWAMQEKPHVSDDAVDMGPIPGTEGIESDPPESPLPDPCSPAELWASMIEELEAERDALKADLADALNYRRFYRDEHKANEALRAMLSHLLKSGRLGGIDAEKVSQLLEGE